MSCVKDRYLYDRSVMVKKFFAYVTGGILMLLLPASVGLSYRSYVEEMEKTRDEQKSFYREIIDEESSWISGLQLDNGAVLLYEPDNGSQGHINPYFACQAMLGLVSDPEGRYLDQVGKYLSWHTDRIIEGNGTVTDYDVENGELVSTGKADSFDSYAAEYILLLSEYLKRSGQVPDASQDTALRLLAGGFEEVLLNDVTYVNNKMRIAYFMDNNEVLEAVQLLEDRPEYEKVKAVLQTSVPERFYMADKGLYSVGIGNDGMLTGEPDLTDFYPDALAQLYPVVTGVVSPKGEREKRLYEQVCSLYRWEEGDDLSENFDWSVMCYVAACMSDIERTDKYLGLYREDVKKDRSYPMHTANAGWVMRCCSKRMEQIDEEYESKTKFGTYINWLIGEVL